VISVSISLDDSAANATTIGTTTDPIDPGVAVVTVTTEVDTTVLVTPTSEVTVSATLNSGDATSTASTTAVTTDATTTGTSTTDNGVVTATASVTVTLTASSVASATSLAPVSLVEIFPTCANLTENIAVLSNVTIPDMVLPSNLTLSQVLGFFGGQIDCQTLLQLLGAGNSTTTGLSRRSIRSPRRTYFEYARKKF